MQESEKLRVDVKGKTTYIEAQSDPGGVHIGTGAQLGRGGNKVQVFIWNIIDEIDGAFGQRQHIEIMKFNCVCMGAFDTQNVKPFRIDDLSEDPGAMGKPRLLSHPDHLL